MLMAFFDTGGRRFQDGKLLPHNAQGFSLLLIGYHQNKHTLFITMKFSTSAAALFIASASAFVPAPHVFVRNCTYLVDFRKGICVCVCRGKKILTQKVAGPLDTSLLFAVLLSFLY